MCDTMDKHEIKSVLEIISPKMCYMIRKPALNVNTLERKIK